MDVLPPTQHEQPPQTWAGHPGHPLVASDGLDRSSIWQTSERLQAAVRERTSPALEGSPVGVKHTLKVRVPVNSNQSSFLRGQTLTNLPTTRFISLISEVVFDHFSDCTCLDRTQTKLASV